MSTEVSGMNGSNARPRIPYFFWLNVQREQQAAENAQSAEPTDDANRNLVYIESPYIPASTADLWRSSSRRAG